MIAVLLSLTLGLGDIAHLDSMVELEDTGEVLAWGTDRDGETVVLLVPVDADDADRDGNLGEPDLVAFAHRFADGEVGVVELAAFLDRLLAPAAASAVPGPPAPRRLRVHGA